MTGSEQQPLAPAALADAGELEAGFAVGEYRIEGLLGKGGMGAVYAARQPEIGKRVAIKVLAAAVARPRLVRRFVDEAARSTRSATPTSSTSSRSGARRRPRSTS